VIKHGDNAYEMLDVIKSNEFNSQVTVKILEQKPVVSQII